MGSLDEAAHSWKPFSWVSDYSQTILGPDNERRWDVCLPIAHLTPRHRSWEALLDSVEQLVSN